VLVYDRIVQGRSKEIGNDFEEGREIVQKCDFAEIEYQKQSRKQPKHLG